MTNLSLTINPEKEIKKIVRFLQHTFRRERVQNAVIGLSGGIDSMTSYFLLKKALPLKNIFPVHLPYDHVSLFILKNIPIISIKKPVDEYKKLLKTYDKIRLGNIMARVRMIILFDLAKKHKALVCGTENKSEHLLGYFTRFGDAASDIEPIQHLYKTQVYQLAKYLGVPQKILDQKPTAGLWSGQTDEKEFGFTYKEADQVLSLYFDKKISTEKIANMGYPNGEKIIAFEKKNSFKLKTPYIIY
ncbi:NAD(+) synthase [Candidatus Roizmanbacteria bacterium]|nr:NAD(+) synthase [Candidatus Roizmanbacteria bacterium]